MPKPRPIAAVLAAAALAYSCTEAPGPATPGNAPAAPSLPTWRFAAPGGHDSGHLLSPDGHKIAWYGTSWGRRKLHVRDFDSGKVRTYRAGGSVAWTADSRRLVFSSDTSGTESSHVFVIDTRSDNAAVDLTPYPGVKAAIQQIVEADPRQLLVTHNRRNPKLFDLYRIDLETGAETLVAANPGNAIAPVTMPDGAMQGWQISREAARPAAEKQRPQAERKPEIMKRNDDQVRVLGAGPGPRVAWALSNRGRDRLALVELDLGRGWERVAFEDPVADVSNVYISRLTHQPLLITALPGYPRVEIPDPDLRRTLEPILRRLAGKPYGLEIGSADRAEMRLVVNLYTSTQNETWLIDRNAGAPQLVGRTVAPELEAALSPVRAVGFAARDGLALKGYLTLPRAPAAQPMPLVLMVHGGPWARNQWIDPPRSEDATRAQFLASRGYAVLQVDFRGSSGYGRAFQGAGVGEFGRRMQDDLLDAVAWAVREGFADARRVAILGFSYGGYAALQAMATAPRTFACGVSIAGPTDLVSLIESFPPYWTVDLSMWHDFVGNPAVPADRAEMTRRSPLANAAGIERPVLLIHGERDVRVRIDQSERMAAAMRAAGREVTLARIPDMGHGIGWWAHQYVVLRETERFLGSCLGGHARSFEWTDPLVRGWMRVSR